VLVLRHELAVLRRQIKRPRWRRRDKLFLAAMSRMLPRERWAAFMVTPVTLLRWHRELVRRKWTHEDQSGAGSVPRSSRTHGERRTGSLNTVGFLGKMSGWCVA